MMAEGASNRRRAYRKGHRGEWLAAQCLRLKGFRIVAKRFKTKSGEVDIIARRGKLILMVEVKARDNVEQAMDAVTQTALRRIAAAGDEWLIKQKNYASLSIRYDLIACLPRRWPIHIPAIYMP
ncbi:YraN family protein [Ahrensia sp. 13_GOM-1096m]|uniref:YraN family protein n=1 Tax=Ahrensia sp. 13_GOM-1096m TaxID=1380380 RepID=UPI00192E4FC1